MTDWRRKRRTALDMSSPALSNSVDDEQENAFVLALDAAPAECVLGKRFFWYNVITMKEG